MAGIWYGFCSPRNTTVEPKNPITLTLSTQTTSIGAEFRYREAGAFAWTTVAGTTPTSYVIPANTLARDKIYVWSGRYQDSGGWSDWVYFNIDTSGIMSFSSSDNNSSSVAGLGPLVSQAGTYEIRIAVKDSQKVVWGYSPWTWFTIHDSRNLVKDADGKWRGVPVYINVGGTFVPAQVP